MFPLIWLVLRIDGADCIVIVLLILIIHMRNFNLIDLSVFFLSSFAFVFALVFALPILIFFINRDL